MALESHGFASFRRVIVSPMQSAATFEGDEGKTALSPKELTRVEHGAVVCYPGTDLSTFDDRVRQLKDIGVEKIILEGDSKVGKLGIVGRGCVSVVVKAQLDSFPGPIALKIRRVDANRIDMMRDFELQSYANTFGVGPRAICASADLFAMEYVDSTKLGKWFASLKTRSSKVYTRALIKNTLEQCFLLDSHGLDHGELSNPTKHVLIRNDSGENPPRVEIIDYESASKERRLSNLTSVAQFLFMSSPKSKKVRKILGFSRFPEKRFISLLRDYKRLPSDSSLQQIFSFLKL